MSTKDIVESHDLDGTVEDADWIKQTWDLPPYLSKEFLAIIAPDRLDWFRTTAVYRNAVANGLIVDDEWLDDYVVDPLKAFADHLVDLIMGDEKMAKGGPGSGPRPKGQALKDNAKQIHAMSNDERDNTATYDRPGGHAASNLYEAQKLCPKPSDKLKRVTDNNTEGLWQDYDYVANVDGEHFGISKYEDPDAGDENEDENGNVKDYIYAYQRLDHPDDKMVETDSANKDDLFEHMRYTNIGLQINDNSKKFVKGGPGSGPHPGEEHREGLYGENSTHYESIVEGFNPSKELAAALHEYAEKPTEGQDRIERGIREEGIQLESGTMLYRGLSMDSDKDVKSAFKDMRRVDPKGVQSVSIEKSVAEEFSGTTGNVGVMMHITVEHEMKMLPVKRSGQSEFVLSKRSVMYVRGTPTKRDGVWHVNVLAKNVY